MVSIENQLQGYYALLLTLNVTLSIIVMLVACLCCKRKEPKNELLGLEGMVKLKNPDDVIVVTNNAVGNSDSHVDLNASTISNAESEKRASTAAHRSLPDIPVTENNGDNGSELYETVADKRLLNNQSSQDKSPTPSLKKQISVSQHSSISQADDVSSPYSRVKNSPHGYAKVRSTEHPYAQLNAPSSSAAAAAALAVSSSNVSNNNNNLLTQNHDVSSRQSHHSSSSQNINDSESQVEIPAASAIAGMISASQDLPYMTPPISNQHFSGDSQDSSKGYTSISVREPLANILAQQPPQPPAIRNPKLASRDVSDSHYATVSDDSDETYAAIEDPNARHLPNISTADIYTSGSETYAQIQPMQSNAIVVAVEINNSNISMAAPTHLSSFNNTLTSEHSSIITIANSSNNSSHANAPHHAVVHRPASSCSDHPLPIPPPVDNLRAQMHSRQASSSSNNSCSMGNLGSPKPEKRQANSPLPPTPKSSNSAGTTSSSNFSARNSVISVIELSGLDGQEIAANAHVSTDVETSPQKKLKSLSPSKDIEGMYAKVMKKNKFSTRNSPSSQNNSPILTRKYNDNSLGISPLDSAAAELMEVQKISVFNAADKSLRLRSNSYGTKDHGYETIPADAIRQNTIVGLDNRKSDCYTSILQKERQLEGAKPPKSADSVPPIVSNETQTTQSSSSSSSPIAYHHEPRSEKHYETIAGARGIPSSNNSDPGYETLKPQTENAKKSSEYDPNYEVLKGPSTAASDDGYAKVVEKKRLNSDDEGTYGYSKVKGDDSEDTAVAGYSTIKEVKLADANHNYASISETKKGTTLDGETDHYARIAEPKTSPPTTPTTLDSLTPTISEKPLTSPTLSSSTVMNNTTSTSVNSNLSTLSSHLTPTSSSQYESLTGSDTDPNYESVSYLKASRENPYERLQTDSSPLTPEPKSASSPSDVTGLVNNNRKSPAATEVSNEIEVDDYFQV